jgi:hypothetical protein
LANSVLQSTLIIALRGPFAGLAISNAAAFKNRLARALLID